MTTRLGFVTRGQLRKLQEAGLGPKEAVDRLLAEAEARHPRMAAIIVPDRDGFSIVGLPK